MKFKIILICCLVSSIVMQLSAQCVYIFQPGPSNGKDAPVFSLPCSSSYATSNSLCDNSGNHINMGGLSTISSSSWTYNGTWAAYRSFLEFNLSSLVSLGCTSKKAFLTLSHSGISSQYNCGTNNTTTSCSSNDFYIYRVTQSWLEDSVIWENQPTYASANVGVDFVYVSDQSQIDQSDYYKTYKIDVTDMVNYWLANPNQNFGFAIKLNNESGYRRLNFASSENANPSTRPKLEVIMDCANGISCSNLITGKIFDDSNSNNCIKDTSDRSLKGWMVEIEPGPIYAITDSSGYYEAWVDKGTYTISELIPTSFWNVSCPSTRTASFTLSGDTSKGNDFANTASKMCSSLWVDIATSRLRPMHTENYIVNYCNNGNVAANNVYIVVTFDNFITPNFSSPISPSNIIGNTWRYNIGTVNPGECNTFYINTTVSTTTAGITQCVEAVIYPNTFCGETVDTTLWDKSSVKVEGACVGDSIARFVIYNTGSAGDGDMDGISQYRVYINDTLVQTQNFQLNGGDSIVVDIKACGNTIRLEADQRLGHPGHSHPRATVEGCGSSCGPVALGYFTTVPEDDQDVFKEIDCHEIITSYDPNEKLVNPKGITSNHYVSSKDELEYILNFQNTGKDTAFYIVVRDTLPEYLNITSAKSGSSSHPYTLKVFGRNILEWTFKNINLVDSATNEPLSHGFVKFKVMQIPNNIDGTVITNRAAIYFDYNAPVLTSPVTVIVNDSQTSTSVIPIDIGNNNLVTVYPNPTTGMFQVESFKSKVEKIEVYNLLGEIICSSIITNNSSFEIDLSNQPNGIYFLKCKTDKGEQRIKVVKQ